MPYFQERERQGFKKKRLTRPLTTQSLNRPREPFGSTAPAPNTTSSTSTSSRAHKTFSWARSRPRHREYLLPTYLSYLISLSHNIQLPFPPPTSTNYLTLLKICKLPTYLTKPLSSQWKQILCPATQRARPVPTGILAFGPGLLGILRQRGRKLRGSMGPADPQQLQEHPRLRSRPVLLLQQLQHRLLDLCRGPDLPDPHHQSRGDLGGE